MRNFNAAAVFILSVIIVVLRNIPNIEGAIQCYKCLVASPPYYTNETIRLCKDFDYSDKFIVNCPYSTFCMKKIISAKIPDPVNGTERDCASQKRERQNYYNEKWHAEFTIENPYEEGCSKVDDKGARTTIIEHCYCKGDLCNSARRASGVQFHILSAVISLTSMRFLWSRV